MNPSIVLPALVTYDCDHTRFADIIHSVSFIVRFDETDVAQARLKTPDLPLWDVLDVGDVNDYNYCVVYSPLMLGKTLELNSEEVMDLVLECINKYYIDKYKNQTCPPLSWDTVFFSQSAYEDYGYIEEFQNAFESWSAKRQKQVLTDHVDAPRSKKKSKI